MIVAIVVSTLSLLTNTIGLAIPYWKQGSVEWRGKLYEAHVGLWKFCGKHGEEKTECVPMEEVMYEHGSYLRATRVMELLGMILIALALLGAFLKLTAMPHQTKVAVAAAILAFIAGIVMIAGTLIYGNNTNRYIAEIGLEFHLHAGYVLCLAGGTLAIIDSCVLAVNVWIILKKKRSSYNEV